jgi:hypothetical protein
LQKAEVFSVKASRDAAAQGGAALFMQILKIIRRIEKKFSGKLWISPHSWKAKIVKGGS